jgi:hypothetical protein
VLFVRVKGRSPAFVMTMAVGEKFAGRFGLAGGGVSGVRTEVVVRAGKR